MAPPSPPRTTASAPGKVLLAGGYLILDRAHTGLVFGLDARMHVQVRALPTGEGVSLQEVVVRSPQFKFAQWRFGYHLLERGRGVKVTLLNVGSQFPSQPNPFVETALSYALTYISTILDLSVISSCWITILADNDYYSVGESDDSSAPETQTPPKERFRTFNVPLWEAHKTGLGSSAALVTAFIAAVVSHYLEQHDFSLATDEGRKRLHNLAQAAHCAAQGKVGSGFDVASAVYGSCAYRRFSPSVLEALGDLGAADFATRLKDVVEDAGPAKHWDAEISKSKVGVPRGLRLVMCDVDCGSQTPGMVRKVLQWRKNDPETAKRVWTALQKCNDEIAAELVRLASGTGDLETSPLRRYLLDNRALVREMSLASDVPIEPKQQTALLDACSELPGVVGGVVPGAGGYDAVVLVVEDKKSVIDRVAQFVAKWRPEDKPHADQIIERVRLLDVREEMEGVKIEDSSKYDAWTGWPRTTIS